MHYHRARFLPTMSALLSFPPPFNRRTPCNEAFDIDCLDALVDVVDERGQIELLMDEYGVDDDAELQAMLGSFGDGREEVPIDHVE